MGLTIDPKHEKRIRIIAETRGESPEELLLEILESGLVSRERAGSLDEESAVARRQRAALETTFEELDQLEEKELVDDRASEHHDEYIYRRDW